MSKDFPAKNSYKHLTWSKIYCSAVWKFEILKSIFKVLGQILRQNMPILDGFFNKTSFEGTVWLFIYQLIHRRNAQIKNMPFVKRLNERMIYMVFFQWLFKKWWEWLEVEPRSLAIWLLHFQQMNPDSFFSTKRSMANQSTGKCTMPFIDNITRKKFLDNRKKMHFYLSLPLSLEGFTAVLFISYKYYNGSRWLRGFFLCFNGAF